MHCYIYASLRRADSYLWLAGRDAFAGLPAALTELLGPLRFAMELELDARRKLPHEDVGQVLDNLSSRGWHLQLPPAQRMATANHLAYGHTPRDGQAR